MNRRYACTARSLCERYVSVLSCCRQALRERHNLHECTSLNKRYMSAIVPYGCQAWTPAMSRCGDVGQLDEWTIGRRTRCLRGRKVMAPCREGREREGSLSGRARDRKQKY